jgi:hypothetical protein
MLKTFLRSLVKLENIKAIHFDDKELDTLVSNAQVRLLSLAQMSVQQSLKVYNFTAQDDKELRAGHGKIPVIKRVREVTNMGLAEAKNFVEKYMADTLGLPAYPPVSNDSYGYR